MSEGGQTYQAGAPTELGSFGLPGSFGVADLGDRTRIVWHYGAQNEIRTFTVRYILTELSVAYDDVVDINLRVWGDEWQVGLERLSARLVLPDRAPGGVYVWGHPAEVDGITELRPDGQGASLDAANVPPNTWVEMRVVAPATVLSDTSGAQGAIRRRARRDPGRGTGGG